MVLTSTATTDANAASRAFRDEIRAAAAAMGYRAYPERDKGNNPIKLDVLTPWGEPVKIPLIVSTPNGQIGVQPIIQEGRGNGYQNVFLRLLATAGAYPFPLAIVVRGDGFIGNTAPARFYKFFKKESAKHPKLAFVGNMSEFRGYLATLDSIDAAAREVA